MSNREVADEFVQWMRTKRGAPPGTLDKYRRLTHAWAAWLPTYLADRTPSDVEAFVSRERRGGTPAANATVVNELAVLGSFHKWGQARLGWGSNPAALAGRPKVHNRQPRPVDDATWLAVWSHDLDDVPRVAMGLAFFCGLRREELVRLQRGQVWNGALVNFKRKNGGEDRIDYTDLFEHWATFMPHLQVQRLERPLLSLARGGGTQPLFGWRAGVRPEILNRHMSLWLADCGLQSHAFTPHQLRHSFATNLLRSGVPLALACDLCNHGSPAVTMRYVRTSGGQLASLRLNAMEVVR